MLLLPTAMTGHLPNGSPMSNLPWNGRTARSHSPTRRTQRTSRTQRTRGHAGVPPHKQTESISAAGTAAHPCNRPGFTVAIDTAAARPSCRSLSHLSHVQQLWNCRTVRSHSSTYRTHWTSRTQGTRRACRIFFAQAGRQHQCIGNCGSSRAVGPVSL